MLYKEPHHTPIGPSYNKGQKDTPHRNWGHTEMPPHEGTISGQWRNQRTQTISYTLTLFNVQNIHTLKDHTHYATQKI